MPLPIDPQKYFDAHGKASDVLHSFTMWLRYWESDERVGISQSVDDFRWFKDFPIKDFVAIAEGTTIRFSFAGRFLELSTYVRDDLIRHEVVNQGVNSFCKDPDLSDDSREIRAYEKVMSRKPLASMLHEEAVNLLQPFEAYMSNIQVESYHNKLRCNSQLGFVARKKGYPSAKVHTYFFRETLARYPNIWGSNAYRHLFGTANKVIIILMNSTSIPHGSLQIGNVGMFDRSAVGLESFLHNPPINTPPQEDARRFSAWYISRMRGKSK